MTISAKIIADSVSPQGIRLASVQTRHPRFIHSELMTHRMLSRNASSSRAIPIERMIEDILQDTAMPIHWGKNQSGMQAREEHHREVGIRRVQVDSLTGYGIDNIEAYDREEAWEEARDRAIEVARAFHKAGYHKQIVNRLLEPFSHINVLITSTSWANFFALRDHEDAQPEIRELARQIKAAMDASTPRQLKPGEWHLPYVDEGDLEEDIRTHRMTVHQAGEAAIKVSVARCARLSYLTFEGKRSTIDEDLALYEKLIGSTPLHASPAEHQATPDKWITDRNGDDGRWLWADQHGNFEGWRQFRKMLPGEYVCDARYEVA